ncbi:MAG: hypothetical protein Q8940_14660 [Bacteroidota bacterium]|nr:hypothetical protein [Bacteroidota bacterium]
MLIGITGIVYFYHKNDITVLNKEKLRLACYSALQKEISEIDSPAVGTKTLNIDSISVKINTRIKGLFYEIDASAKKYKDSVSIQYLLGSAVAEPFDNGLIITKPQKQISVAGSTNIVGNILSSEGKVLYSSIYGVAPTNDDYLHGNVYKNADLKPKLAVDSLVRKIVLNNKISQESKAGRDENVILQSKEMLLNLPLFTIINGDLIIKGAINTPSEMPDKEIIVRGKVVFENGAIINSNINIFTDSSLFIGESAVLENILASARGTIDIAQNSKLKCVQIFSQKEINITNSRINYPSVICLYVDASDSKNYNNRINIISSNINGSVMLVSSVSGISKNKSRIIVDESSKLQGLIYSENELELRGELKGIAYTFATYFYKEPTEYNNWLINFRLNRDQMDKWFLLPLGMLNKNRFEILKETCIY